MAKVFVVVKWGNFAKSGHTERNLGYCWTQFQPNPRLNSLLSHGKSTKFWNCETQICRFGNRGSFNKTESFQSVPKSVFYIITVLKN